jgi:hypothetical protein
VSVSYTEEKRALFLRQQLKELPADQLIFIQALEAHPRQENCSSRMATSRSGEYRAGEDCARGAGTLTNVMKKRYKAGKRAGGKLVEMKR